MVENEVIIIIIKKRERCYGREEEVIKKWERIIHFSLN